MPKSAIFSPLAQDLSRVSSCDGRLSPGKRAGLPRLWTTEEDVALRAAVARFGERNWKGIASFVPNRNHTQCFQRWHKVLCPGLRKGRWSKQEDELLLEHANIQLKQCEVRGIPQKVSWGILCKAIEGRTAKQCRERWLNNVNPNINRGPWTVEEDQLIIHYSTLHPNKWAFIAKQLDRRTENAVKLRFFALRKLKNVQKRLHSRSSLLESSQHKPLKPFQITDPMFLSPLGDLTQASLHFPTPSSQQRLRSSILGKRTLAAMANGANLDGSFLMKERNMEHLLKLSPLMPLAGPHCLSQPQLSQSSLPTVSINLENSFPSQLDATYGASNQLLNSFLDKMYTTPHASSSLQPLLWMLVHNNS